MPKDNETVTSTVHIPSKVTIPIITRFVMPDGFRLKKRKNQILIWEVFTNARDSTITYLAI